MKRYFAKPDTWFKEGTECKCLEEFCPFGSIFHDDGTPTSSALYEGTYVVGSDSEYCKYDEVWHRKGYNDHDEVVMREHCNDDEFYVTDSEDE